MRNTNFIKAAALLSFCFIILAANSLQAQFQRAGFAGWLDDNHYLERRMESGELVTYSVNVTSGNAEVYVGSANPRQEVIDALPEGYSLSNTDPFTDGYADVILSKDNNLFHFVKATSAIKQITNNASEERNPTFSPDGKKIAFTRDNDLYMIDLVSGQEKRLTTDGTDLIYNGWASWVYYEEILGRGSRYRAFWWAPDSEQIAYLRFDDATVPMFPIYRSEGTHGDLEQTRYPKAGDPNPDVKLGVVKTSNAQTTWMDIDYTQDQYIAWPFWTKDSSSLLFQILNRDQDHIVLYMGNPANGSKKVVYEEKRPTWVEFFTDIYFFENESGFILRSYRTDWEDLYYYSMDGELIARLSDTDWRVNSLSKVLEDKGKAFFTGPGEVNTDNHLYSVNLDGTNFKQLTAGKGTHSTSISPNGSYFVDIYSHINQAPITNLYDADGKLIRTIQKEETPEFDPAKHHKVEMFTIKTDDGKFDMPVIWVLPANFDKTKKYPVVFSIYGGPDSQGVRDSWRGYGGTNLTQMDIIQFTVDHRASGKFGREGLDYMHRSLGKWEIIDYVTAVEWLREQPFVDPSKMGITGGSYGGYMSALALTLAPDHFTHAIANYSVTDWRLYDNVYTERYMDTPQDNAEGYDYGSVLKHVANFKGKLLITHGLMDDNVHMQNTVQFLEAMQQEGKDFDVMFYPNARHGYGGAYGRHHAMMRDKFWKKHFFGVED
ncbi:DPP IV N-terminal domain-containing protein [Fulvivirgaceae bacterium LMO-SS25]